MKIIQKEPRANGGRPPMQSWSSITPPDGFVLVPDDFDAEIFQSFRGFVHIEHDGTYLTGMTGNQDALNAYLEEFPDVEPGDPEPTPQDDTDALMVDHELRITILELGLTE